MRFRRTTWLMWGLVGFLLGLVLARFLPVLPASWIWLAASLALATKRSYKLVGILTFGLLGISVGLWRGGQYLSQLNHYQNYYEQQVVIIGKAASDGVYGERSQMVFDLTDIEIIDPVGNRSPKATVTGEQARPISDGVDPVQMKLPGKIAVGGFNARSVIRGDMVQAEGKLYPSRGSRQARLSFAELKVLGRTDSVVEDARLGFAAGMQNALPEPQASFGLGLLIGQRNTLPDETLAALSAVGLTHIVAVSGYNLTILERAVRRWLGRRSKFQTLVGSLVLMMAFLLITGLSASIVRAAIVGSLSLLAWYWGREFKPILLILIAAGLTAGWQPSYIWSDIGWHLSFLAFFGVLVLAPLLIKRFMSKPPKNLMLVIIESLCAWAMTAPLIMFIFKEVSLIALAANTLVVPLVPLAMLLSALAGLAGAWLTPLAGWAALPANLLLTYTLDIANLLSQWPRALIRHSLSVWQMTGLYSNLLLFCLLLWRRTRRNKAVETEAVILEA